MTRLSVSNLAWPAELESRAFQELVRLGVGGIEVAPTRLGSWESCTPRRMTEWRQRLNGIGLEVSSLQAILFGTDGLTLLGAPASFAAMRDHLRRVADIAAALGAGTMVFGSPRNRLRGEMPFDDAWSLAGDRWRDLGEIAAAAGAAIGIEPVPAYYGGDFLASWSEVSRMVKDVDHPGIRVHLDTGCVALGGDRIDEAVIACAPWLAHFHAAQPDLRDFADPLPGHAEAAIALRAVGYAGWIAIEMREQPSDPIAAVCAAVCAVKGLYGMP